MSLRQSVKQLAERALRRIGAYSINDTGADSAELEEALYWMDLVVAELAGTEDCSWLTEDTIDIPFVAGQASYALNTATDWPDTDIAFPVSAYVREDTGVDTDIEMIRRVEYESIADKDAGGSPTVVYIDRTADVPRATIYPVPTDTGASLRLVVQKQAPDMIGSGGARPGKLDHGFPKEWQRWLVLATAAEIGAGPVRKLSQQEINDIRAGAVDAKARLMARANVENKSVRRTQAWGA